MSLKSDTLYILVLTYSLMFIFPDLFFFYLASLLVHSYQHLPFPALPLSCCIFHFLSIILCLFLLFCTLFPLLSFQIFYSMFTFCLILPCSFQFPLHPLITLLLALSYCLQCPFIISLPSSTLSRHTVNSLLTQFHVLSFSR